MAPLRLAAGIAALAAGIAAVALAALLLHRTPGPVSVTPATAPSAPVPSAPPSSPRFPAPPAGAIVFSREDGARVLALAVLPGRAQVSVVGPQGTGVGGLAVTVNGVAAKPCGAGCYAAPATPPVDVRVGATAWRVQVPAQAPDASALVARAARVWRALRSLAWDDTLGSDSTHVVRSTWRVAAPDRLAYHVRNGWDGIVIGGRRWDRAPRGRWVQSAQDPRLRQPLPVWVSAVDAHVVGRTGAAWRITFYDPRTPAWFDIVLDRRTFHTLDLHMRTTAHFMHETYGSFDSAPAITSP